MKYLLINQSSGIFEEVVQFLKPLDPELEVYHAPNSESASRYLKFAKPDIIIENLRDLTNEEAVGKC